MDVVGQFEKEKPGVSHSESDKGYSAMKCHSCGTDLKGQSVCSQCGKRAEDPLQRIEIEYKDFKVSELLEIRSGEHRPPSEKPHFGKTGVQDIPGSADSAPSPERKEPREEPAGYRPGVHEGKSSSPFLFALILFLLALFASAALLWKLLVH